MVLDRTYPCGQEASHATCREHGPGTSAPTSKPPPMSYATPFLCVTCTARAPFDMRDLLHLLPATKMQEPMLRLSVRCSVARGGLFAPRS